MNQLHVGLFNVCTECNLILSDIYSCESIFFGFCFRIFRGIFFLILKMEKKEHIIFFF